MVSSTTLRVGLFSLAALLLGAHFFRADDPMLVVLCLVTPLGFLVKQRWSLYLLQISAYCAAATWVSVAIQLVALRQNLGQPWKLTATILGAVALLTLLSGLLLNSRSIKQHYSK